MAKKNTGKAAKIGKSLLAMDGDDARKASIRERNARDARMEGAMTWEEIAAEGRPPTKRTPMPPEGIYIGSGVYGHHGRLKIAGYCFTYWEPDRPSPEACLDMLVKEGVGNTMQWWQKGHEIISLAKRAKELGVYSTCLGGGPDAEDAGEIAALGGWWLGYDFGERFNFGFFPSVADRDPDLKLLVDEYMRRVHNHVKDSHAAGVGLVMATSSNFPLDYEVAAGAEIPCTEDFPFGDFQLSSALGRGLFRQYSLPMWGAHIAHEWYSFLPHTSRYKMRSLETAFLVKYMTGAKIVINESGNWALQSNLCPDSPMSTLPILKGDPPNLYMPEDPRSGYTPEHLDAARRLFANIDDRSPVATKYRRIISKFTAFCRENPAPKGQPEAAIALAKGNYDIGSAIFVPGYVVGNARTWAAKDMHWYFGAPEKSWQTLLAELMPKPPMFAPHYNRSFSGTPYGLCDVVSFGCDNVSADYLLRNYRTIIFSGWNTCSDKQYKVLCDYVHGGGRLVLSLPHLSTNRVRNYTDFTVEELVNGGDFTELCGLRVKGRGRMCYWGTGPEMRPNAAGFVARRRFGILGVTLGELELTGPEEDYERLVVDDERLRPIILRCKSGKGEVFFVNTWAYPATVNLDEGPGLEEGGRGMMSRLYAYVARISRGHTWITGPDFETPDEDCRWIMQSYFPDAGKICLLNLDYERPRRCVLHWFGDKDFIELAPGEFRQMDAPVLEPHEKLNAD